MRERKKALDDLSEDIAYNKRSNDLINKELDALPKGKISATLEFCYSYNQWNLILQKYFFCGLYNFCVTIFSHFICDYQLLF